MVEDKYIDIWCIRSEDNPAEIMTKNTPEADLEIHLKRITEGELWELVDTGRDDVNNTIVMDDVISPDKTEYFILALVEVVDGKHKKNWILVMRSMIGK